MRLLQSIRGEEHLRRSDLPADVLERHDQLAAEAFRIQFQFGADTWAVRFRKMKNGLRQAAASPGRFVSPQSPFSGYAAAAASNSYSRAWHANRSTPHEPLRRSLESARMGRTGRVSRNEVVQRTCRRSNLLYRD